MIFFFLLSIRFVFFFFFFSSRRRHTRSLRDWSSDVCSSDLDALLQQRKLLTPERGRLGVAVRLTGVRTDEIEEQSLALGEVALGADGRDADDHRGSDRQVDRNEVLAANVAVELVVET